MKTNEISRLALRLTGLIFVALAIFQLPGVLLALIALVTQGIDRGGGAMFLHFLSMLFMGIGGVLLCAFSSRLSLLLMRGINDVENPVGLTMESLQVWSISLLGLIIAANALPQLGELLSFRYFLVFNGAISSGNERDNAMIVARIFQLVLGLAMFLGSSGIVGMRQRFREFGLNK